LSFNVLLLPTSIGPKPIGPGAAFEEIVVQPYALLGGGRDDGLEGVPRPCARFRLRVKTDIAFVDSSAGRQLHIINCVGDLGMREHPQEQIAVRPGFGDPPDNALRPTD
jgi:hypothetical protein